MYISPIFSQQPIINLPEGGQELTINRVRLEWDSYEGQYIDYIYLYLSDGSTWVLDRLTFDYGAVKNVQYINGSKVIAVRKPNNGSYLLINDKFGEQVRINFLGSGYGFSTWQ